MSDHVKHGLTHAGVHLATEAGKTDTARQAALAVAGGAVAAAKAAAVAAAAVPLAPVLLAGAAIYAGVKAAEKAGI